jgi:AcrR family transcriptional regulator
LAKRSNSAERILREAIRLFADKGFERTSVADIQAAVGLNPGSGALYKHFPSKEAVLTAAVDDFIAPVAEAKNALAASKGPVDETLERMARMTLAMLAADRDMLRILWRELDHFPSLRDRARNERIQASYAALGQWVRAETDAGVLAVDDPEATAAVMLASLIMFRLLDICLGETPGRISEDRFVAAWLKLVLHGAMPATGATEPNRTAAIDPDADTSRELSDASTRPE